MSFLQIPIQTYPNTALGYQALTNAVIAPPFSGQNNTAFGDGALQQNTTGYQNVAIGKATLRDNTTGNNNTSVGMNAAVFNITGNANTAVGAQAFWIGTGDSNTAIGAAALASLTTGIQNTGVGNNAGSAITTGSSNVVLGSYTGNQGGLDIRTLSNYIVLSDGAGNPRLWIDPAGLVTAPGGFAGIGGGGTITLNNQTANYTVVSGDAGKAINCTANTFTVSLTAAATLGSGFACFIWNTGTGVITIDPNGAETIDGQTTLTLRQGEGTQIVCNGTNWLTGSGKELRGYAENFAAASTRPSAFGASSTAIGQSAQANGLESVAVGASALATSNYASSFGSRSSASGLSSSCFGYLSSASGSDSSAIGSSCTAARPASFAVGKDSFADFAGKYVFSNGLLTTSGDNQFGLTVLKATTTGATGVVMTTNGTAGGAINQLNVPAASAFTFSGNVVARRQTAGGTESAAWRVEGLVRRESTAATTVLVASTVTVISNAPGWTLALAADTTNGGVSFTATGAAGLNVRWVATINSAEITYA